MRTDEVKARLLKAVVAPLLRLWIRHYWGPRCEARDPNCACCQAWEMYYKLLDEPVPDWPLDE